MSSALDPPTASERATLNIADDDENNNKDDDKDDTRWPVITHVQSAKPPLLALNM